MWMHRRICNCGGKWNIQNLTETFKIVIVCFSVWIIFILHNYLLLFNNGELVHFSRKFKTPCNFTELLFQKNFEIPRKDMTELFYFVKNFDPIPTNFDEIFMRDSINSTKKFLIRMKEACLKSRIQNTVQNIQKIRTKNAINKNSAVIFILFYHIFLYFYTKNLRKKWKYCFLLKVIMWGMSLLYFLYVFLDTEALYLCIFGIPSFLYAFHCIFIDPRNYSVILCNIAQLIFSLFLCIQILFFQTGICLLKKEIKKNFPEIFFNELCLK